jgi:type III secretory pathway component EscR
VREHLKRFTAAAEREFSLRASSRLWSNQPHAAVMSDDLIIPVPSFSTVLMPLGLSRISGVRP